MLRAFALYASALLIFAMPAKAATVPTMPGGPFWPRYAPLALCGSNAPLVGLDDPETPEKMGLTGFKMLAAQHNSFIAPQHTMLKVYLSREYNAIVAPDVPAYFCPVLWVLRHNLVDVRGQPIGLWQKPPEQAVTFTESGGMSRPEFLFDLQSIEKIR